MGCHLLIQADNVNLLGGKLNIVGKNTVYLVASKEARLKVNTKGIRYLFTFVSRLRNRGQNHKINITNFFFQNVAKFKCQRTK